MMREVEISITQADIQNGTPRRDKSDPLAIAFNRIILPELYTEVGSFIVQIRRKVERNSKEKSTFFWMLPAEIRTWLDYYDTYREAQPISFKVSLPIRILKGTSARTKTQTV